MEILSLGPAEHSLSQRANYTHPETPGEGLSRCREEVVWEVPRSQARSGPQSCAHAIVHPGPRPSSQEVPRTVSAGRQEGPTKEEQRAEQNLCSCAVRRPLRAPGEQLEPGGWVTWYLLHLSGKADENSCGLLPLETTQGPDLLGTCWASHMESLQHEGNGQH